MLECEYYSSTRVAIGTSRLLHAITDAGMGLVTSVCEHLAMG